MRYSNRSGIINQFELDRAEKVFLLLQSAVYAAEVAENIQDAKDKYSKANEMCTEVCACGC